jgi:hypothetical protein
MQIDWKLEDLAVIALVSPLALCHLGFVQTLIELLRLPYQFDALPQVLDSLIVVFVEHVRLCSYAQSL